MPPKRSEQSQFPGLVGQLWPEIRVSQADERPGPVPHTQGFKVYTAVLRHDILHIGAGGSDSGASWKLCYDAAGLPDLLVVHGGGDGKKGLATPRHLGTPDEVHLAAGGTVLPPGEIVRVDLPEQVDGKGGVHRDHVVIFGNINSAFLQNIPFFQTYPQASLFFNGILIIIIIAKYPGGLVRLLGSIKNGVKRLYVKGRTYKYGPEE